MSTPDPRISQLSQSVADLAQTQRELYLRVEALTTLLERQQAEQTGDASGSVAALAALPEAPPPPRRSFWKRAARFALRKTLGTARKLWDAAHPDPPWADEVVAVRAAAPAKIPRLWLPEQAEEASAEDLLWTAPPPDELPESFAETACLLAAVEGLDMLRCDAPGGSHWIVRRNLWNRETGIDLDMLRKSVDEAQRPLGKVLGPANLDGPLPSLPDGRPLLRRSGAYLVAASDTPRQWHLPLAPLDAPSPHEGMHWIVAEEPLARGLDRALLRVLGMEPAAAVAVLRADALSRRRAAWMARASGRVWFLGDFESVCVEGVLQYLGGGRHRLARDLPPGEKAAIPLDCSARTSLRRELGAVDEDLVVLWADDLLPEARPEEFILLAKALQDRPEFLFVIDSDGPLLGSMRDLRAYLGVERLLFAPHLAAVDAAADIVCHTTELNFPDRIEAARAAGLRILTPSGGSLEEALRKIER